jgi:hypothetical protein
MNGDGAKDLLDLMRREDLAAHEEFLRHMSATFERLDKQLDDLLASVRRLGENIDRFGTSLGEHIEQSAAETHALIRSLVKR